MMQGEECVLNRYITALPKDLWRLAMDAFEELANNPFLPVLDEDEVARLICSPGFQRYLEGELRLREGSLVCKYSC